MSAMYEPTKIVSAAILYFLIVFGVGFLLGPIRVFWLAPRFGETIAVLCEAPFILMAVILAARWLPHKLKLQPNLGSLAGMALGGLFFTASGRLRSWRIPTRHYASRTARAPCDASRVDLRRVATRVRRNARVGRPPPGYRLNCFEPVGGGSIV
jgi:hypothetical protein